MSGPSLDIGYGRVGRMAFGSGQRLLGFTETTPNLVVDRAQGQKGGDHGAAAGVGRVSGREDRETGRGDRDGREVETIRATGTIDYLPVYIQALSELVWNSFFF